MKKILVYSPDPLTGVAAYRAHGPLMALRDQVSYTLFSNRMEEVTHWPWFRSYDLCLMHLGHRLQDLVFAENCKKYGLPLWVDWDDPLFDVPPENKHYETYGNPKCREYMTGILKMADVITVSSLIEREKLVRTLNIQKERIIHLPIALDDRLLMHRAPFKYSRRVAWRGSESHLYDLITYRDALESVINEKDGMGKPRTEWKFFGVSPYFMSLPLSNHSYVKTMNMIDYHMALAQYNPMVVAIPLKDHHFNRVKSHLGWLDATLCGAVTFGPRLPEWTKLPGCATYEIDSNTDFVSKFRALLEMGEDNLKEMHRASMEHLIDNYLLSKTNRIRLGIIKELT